MEIAIKGPETRKFGVIDWLRLGFCFALMVAAIIRMDVILWITFAGCTLIYCSHWIPQYSLPTRIEINRTGLHISRRSIFRDQVVNWADVEETHEKEASIWIYYRDCGHPSSININRDWMPAEDWLKLSAEIRRYTTAKQAGGPAPHHPVDTPVA